MTYAHGLADYNGHFGIRELCDICPSSQLRRCADEWQPPEFADVAGMVEELGGTLVEINDRAIVVAGLDEPPRYYMQHGLGFQVHDVTKPHHPYQHGRADIGWPTAQEAG